MVGFVKAPVFALIIGVIGCHAGMQVRGNAESLGAQTSAAVVRAIFAVIVADALFSVFFCHDGYLMSQDVVIKNCVASAMLSGRTRCMKTSTSMFIAERCWVLSAGRVAGNRCCLRCIAGLRPPQAGTIEIFGQDALNCSEAARLEIDQRMGVMFQDGALFFQPDRARECRSAAAHN